MTLELRTRLVNEHKIRKTGNTIRTTISVHPNGDLVLRKEWSNPGLEDGAWKEIKSFKFHMVDAVEVSAALLDEAAQFMRGKQKRSHHKQDRRNKVLSVRKECV